MAVIFSYVLADIAVVVGTLIAVVYLYFAQGFKYWQKRGVPCDHPTSVFGSMGGLIFQTESFGEIFKRFYDQFLGEPFVGVYVARKPILVLRDLDLLRRVLVKDAHAFLDRSVDVSEDSDPLFTKSLFFLQGKKWRHLRIKLTPTFTSGKMKNMFYLINECGKKLLPCIEQDMSKNKSVVVKETAARYSTDVIALCAFGVDANSLQNPHSEFRTIMRKAIDPTPYQNFVGMLGFFVPWLVNTLKLKSYDENVRTFLRNTFWDVVTYRKENGVVRKDFVDILSRLKTDGEVRAEDEKELEEIKEDSKYLEHLRNDKEEIKLEDDDFVAQAFIFLVAGFETSSSVISFTLYELALNPDIQYKLRREILAVLGKHNSEVTYDALAEMSYLEMVVSETMRKYPTLPFLERKCLQDYKIPGTDVIIEKGVSVMIPVLGIHWDPLIYPEPEKFDPERFNATNRSKRSNFAHLPFGEGPRICIGMRFGQMQVKTSLVHILATYNVKTCAETPLPPLKMKIFAGLSIPKKDIVLAFEKINSSSSQN